MSTNFILYSHAITMIFLFHQYTHNDWSIFLYFRADSEESRMYYENGGVEEGRPDKIMTKSSVKDREFYIIVYSVIVILIFIVGITRSFTFYAVCLRCSQRLHDLVFGALIRASMRFFDTNPSGRILNRFSKDMGAIDELLPKAILDSGQIILMAVGSLTITCIANVYFIIPIIVIGFIFYWVRKVYLKTSKNVKRLEGMSKYIDDF